MDAEVDLYSRVGGEWQIAKIAYVRSTAAYSFDGLSDGTYRVQFYDYSGRYAAEWWPGEAPSGSPGEIVVQDGTAVSDIDGVLGDGGGISGLVRGPAGPQVRMSVDAYTRDGAGWEHVGQTSTDASGQFVMTHLAAGTYRIAFNADGQDQTVPVQYFGGGSDIDDARDVQVVEGTMRSAVDASLSAGGGVSGTVLRPDADDGAVVLLYEQREDGSFGHSRSTYTATGTYAFGHLPSGHYKIEFRSDGDDSLSGEFFSDGSTLATADVVDVVDGSTTAGIDGALYSTSANNRIVSSGAPVVDGRPSVGTVLNASTGSWTPTPDAFSYQWMVGGADVPGATSSTYVVAASDLDKTVSVKVRASKAGYHSATAASEPTATVDRGTVVSVMSPTVTGTAQVGQTLTTAGDTWSPADVTRTYQWSVGGAAVGGATGTTYAVQPGDLGKTVTVTVSVSKDGYTSTPATSTPTAAVVAAPVITTPPPPPSTTPVQPKVITNSAAPAISGSAVVGQKLKASGGSWTPGTVALSYQWQLNGTDIATATSSTLKLKANMAGKKVTVKVTATAAGYSSATATSKATKKVKGKPKHKPKPKHKKVLMDERRSPAVGFRRAA